MDRTLSAPHFVDGGPLADADGAPLVTEYPATGETLARFHAATGEVIERAFDSAARAQAEWAARAPVERGRVLVKAAEIMRARKRALSES